MAALSILVALLFTGALYQVVGARRDRHAPPGELVDVGVVRAYAAQHPENVAAIVMVDPPTDWITGDPRRAYLLRRGVRLSRVGSVLARLGIIRASLALLTGGAPGAPRRLAKVFGPTASATLERLVGEVRKLPPDVHPMVKAHWCQPKCFTAMGDYIGAFLRDKSAMAALTPPPHIPVVVVSGGNQPAETLASQRALTVTSLNGRHLIARGSAHWVQFDEPELIVGIVRELVDTLRSANQVARQT